MTADERYQLAPEVAQDTRAEELEATMLAHSAKCEGCASNSPCPFGENLLLAILEAA